MNGVLAGKTCAVCGGSAVGVAAAAAAAAVVAAVGTHPETGSLVGDCNRHEVTEENTSTMTTSNCYLVHDRRWPGGELNKTPAVY